MKLKVYYYKREFQDIPYRLFPMGNDAWIALDDWQNSSELKGLQGDVFVKIERHDKYSDFVIYKQLHASQSNEFKNYVRLPNFTKSKSDLTDNKISEVDISVIDTKSALIPSVKFVKIKVNEHDVEDWTKRDVENAITALKEQSIYCMEQRLFVNRTKFDFAIGEFLEIEPMPESKHSPFWITPNTEFKFEGMPALEERIDFDKIGGQKKVIDELRRIIQLPMNYPNYFEKFDTNPPKGILLYGPPGNGKTLIAKAVAQSLSASFIEIDLTDALQKYKGVGEYNLGKKFEEAERKKNAVIFIDEIDSIASVRTQDSEGHEVTLVGKLLSLMDGIKSTHRVVVIGATNRLYAIDPALRRPGRFDKELEVPMPNCEARLDILKKYVKLEKQERFDSSVNEEYLEQLATEIDGYSGADIKALYTESVMSAINKQLHFNEKGKATMMKSVDEVVITKDDFEKAKEVVKTTQRRKLETEEQMRAFRES